MSRTKQTPQIILDLLEILNSKQIRYTELSDCVIVPFIKSGPEAMPEPHTFHRHGM